MNPLISVYITNHNYGAYIEKAIKSVLDQTLEDFELIIIDDGSTDNSKEIIESYKHLEFVSIIYQQNKGLNVTNNIAIRASKGKYIIRLDADDYFDKNALLLLSNELEQNKNLGLVFPDYYLVDEHDQVIGLERRHEFEKNVVLYDQPAHGACTMIRKKFLVELGGYDESFTCQDGYDLWLKFVDQHDVKNINTPLFYYRQHGSNLTKNEKRILSTRQKIKKKFLEKQKKEDYDTLAIIPFRGAKTNSFQLAFEKVNGQNIVDLKVQEALKARHIIEVVVTTPDESVLTYVKDRYGDNTRVTIHNRQSDLARHNVRFDVTVEEIVNSVINHERFQAFMVLSPEFPFITVNEIEDAIHTLLIFDADSLISVRPETNMLFQHDGEGMKVILNQDKFTKLEREVLYRYTGGISLTTRDYFLNFKKLIGGKVGHIVLDQVSAHGIFSEFDLKLAGYLNATELIK